MAIELKWVGFDFGQCMMDPTGLRNHLVIGDVSKEMGEPELVEERIHRYRVLKEKYGSYSIVKEGHRDEIMSYVFDGKEEAREIFSAKEQEHLLMGSVLEEKATVKEGGKTEHLFYDKKRPNFKMEESAAGSARYAALLDSLQGLLEKKGISISGLLAMSEGDRVPLYKELALTLGLRGTEQQQDVYGFLTVALERLGR